MDIDMSQYSFEGLKLCGTSSEDNAYINIIIYSINKFTNNICHYVRYSNVEDCDLLLLLLTRNKSSEIEMLNISRIEHLCDIIPILSDDTKRSLISLNRYDITTMLLNTYSITINDLTSCSLITNMDLNDKDFGREMYNTFQNLLNEYKNLIAGIVRKNIRTISFNLLKRYWDELMSNRTQIIKLNYIHYRSQMVSYISENKIINHYTYKCLHMIVLKNELKLTIYSAQQSGRIDLFIVTLFSTLEFPCLTLELIIEQSSIRDKSTTEQTSLQLVCFSNNIAHVIIDYCYLHGTVNYSGLKDVIFSDNSTVKIRNKYD